MTTNLHYLIAGMAVLLVVLWQYSHQRQMDDRNSLMFRRLLTVVSLDVLAELVSTCFILYAPYSFGVGRMLSNTVFYLFQAILPLWGKMLNVEKARADKVYGNDKLTPVITALGAGIGDDFDLNKLRYHKVIIMADADVDGAHIRTLLLTFFFRFMRPLIDNGYVYAAVPPLYKLTKGKTTRVAFSDEERDKISAELRGDNPNAKVVINRYKGLGEMDPHELWETTMNPETRTLRRITLEDAVKADEIFTILMGEKVEPRKEFIEENAKYVVNLDI